nr:uncharacterized protein LOC129034804 [Pongo pygmaeus]
MMLPLTRLWPLLRSGCAARGSRRGSPRGGCGGAGPAAGLSPGSGCGGGGGGGRQRRQLPPLSSGPLRSAPWYGTYRGPVTQHVRRGLSRGSGEGGQRAGGVLPDPDRDRDSDSDPILSPAPLGHFPLRPGSAGSTSSKFVAALRSRACMGWQSWRACVSPPVWPGHVRCAEGLHLLHQVLKMESPLRAETLPAACAFLQDCALTQPLRGSLCSGPPRPSVVGCPSLSEKGQQGAPNPHVSAGRGRLGHVMLNKSREVESPLSSRPVGCPLFPQDHSRPCDLWSLMSGPSEGLTACAIGDWIIKVLDRTCQAVECVGHFLKFLVSSYEKKTSFYHLKVKKEEKCVFDKRSPFSFGN